jgi:hypothetical protein
MRSNPFEGIVLDMLRHLASQYLNQKPFEDS